MVIFPILSFSLVVSHCLQDVGIGLKIGNINVNNTGCADDIALLSIQLSDVQIMVNMALDFANLEGYELQTKKSVAIHISGLIYSL
jgi:hypothetical protein